MNDPLGPNERPNFWKESGAPPAREAWQRQVARAARSLPQRPSRLRRLARAASRGLSPLAAWPLATAVMALAAAVFIPLAPQDSALERTPEAGRGVAWAESVDLLSYADFLDGRTDLPPREDWVGVLMFEEVLID